jgi:uncharacterized protein
VNDNLSIGGTNPGHRTSDSTHGAIAPVWHTLVVLLVLFGMSWASARAGNRLAATPRAKLSNYIVVIITEWAIVAFIAFSMKRRGFRISEIVGGRWASAREIFRDLGIGLAFMVVCGGGILNGLGHLLKASPNQTLKSVLPQSGSELIVWVLMSLTAGFCEELIFRGYLQRQFSALTRATAGGIVLQGLVFGAAHGYQGWKYMLLISVYGILFGLLALWRRSLRPGMIAHGLQDTLGGILGRYLMR